jgi:hypothetical protein
MAFWLKFTGQGGAVDRFDREAMTRYCEHVGGLRKLSAQVRKDSRLFCDSFEVSSFRMGSIGRRDFGDFQGLKGYDLEPFLPPSVGVRRSPRVDTTSAVPPSDGAEAFFDPFLAWCEDRWNPGTNSNYGSPTISKLRPRPLPRGDHRRQDASRFDTHRAERMSLGLSL